MIKILKICLKIASIYIAVFFQKVVMRKAEAPELFDFSFSGFSRFLLSFFVLVAPAKPQLFRDFLLTHIENQCLTDIF